MPTKIKKKLSLLAKFRKEKYGTQKKASDAFREMFGEKMVPAILSMYENRVFGASARRFEQFSKFLGLNPLEKKQLKNFFGGARWGESKDIKEKNDYKKRREDYLKMERSIQEIKGRELTDQERVFVTLLSF